MIEISFAPTEEAKKVLGGMFPTELSTHSHLPVYSPAESKIGDIRGGVFSENNVYHIADEILTVMSNRFIPLKSHALEINNFLLQNNIRKSPFLVSISFIYMLRDEVITDEDIADVDFEYIRHHQIIIGRKSQTKQENLPYSLNEDFFSMLEKYKDNKPIIKEIILNPIFLKDPYFFEFINSLFHLFYFREHILTSSSNFRDMTKEEYKNEFLSDAERGYIYGKK